MKVEIKKETRKTGEKQEKERRGVRIQNKMRGEKK